MFLVLPPPLFVEFLTWIAPPNVNVGRMLYDDGPADEDEEGLSKLREEEADEEAVGLKAAAMGERAALDRADAVEGNESRVSQDIVSDGYRLDPSG